jgi:hypothetical protein
MPSESNPDKDYSRLRLAGVFCFALFCRDFDWDDFRPEWKPEWVPNAVRRRMRVPNTPFREFQCVSCSAAGSNARQQGNQCGEWCGFDTAVNPLPGFRFDC